MFAKVSVNGPSAHPCWTQLKKDVGGGDIEWNFSKFLVVNGKGIKRWGDETDPADLIEDIEEALGISESKAGLIDDEGRDL